jgi:hypothetical protein
MDIGDLVISLRLRTEALERGLNETQRKLREQDRAAREAAAGQRELQGAYTRTAAIAGVAFAAITAAVLSGVKAYTEYTSVMKGFENQIKATGQSVSQAKDVMAELSSDGLISESDTAAAIKNLVNYGFTIEKAKKTLEALKDTAVDNRQTHYNLGEAIRVTTEGIRMENSVLSDAAGIQKNIAKMKDEYAKSLNKTADSLTAAEKAEAIYQGVLAESGANMGRAAEYASELGGQQAQLAAETIKVNQAFGGSMAPVVSGLLSLFQPLLNFITSMIQKNPALTATITTMVASMLALITVIGGVTAAMMAWKVASGVLGTALSALALNPWVLGITAAVGVLTLFTSSMQKAKQAAKELKEAQDEYQQVVNQGIEKNAIEATEEKIKKLNELKEMYQELIDVAAKSDSANLGNNVGALFSAAKETGFKLEDLTKTAREFGIELEFIDQQAGKIATVTMDQLTNQIETYTKAIKDANKATTAEVNEMAQQTAMKNREVLVVQNLLKQYTAAKKGSSEWSSAQQELSKLFPQFSTAIGINEDAIRGLMIVKQQEISVAWASVQVKANEIIMEKKRELAIREAAIAALDAGVKWLFGMNEAAGATKLAREEVEKLKGEITSLQALATMDPSQVAGVPVVEAPKILDDGPYKNAALDNAYKLMEHRKKMNELTLEDELKTLEQIKRLNVKTADERMQIEERIYEVKQQLGDKSLEQALKYYDRTKERGLLNENDEIVLLQRIKQRYADSVDERAKLDDMIFDASQRKTEAKKAFDTDVLSETTRLFKEAAEDRLLKETLTAEQRFEIQRKTFTQTIAENQAYLQKVLADDKYTAKEKEQIQREITSSIRTNVNERLQLEKDYYSQVKQDNINSINDLSKGIQSALREKYEAEKSIEEDRIKGLLDANEQWKKNATDIAKSTYDARLKAAQDGADAELALINQVYGAQIQAVQDELAALEQAEKQKTRAELDADDATKAARLRSKIEYEHDEFNKAALQKELNKVLADQAKRHEDEQLADKKDALKTEEQTLKDKLKEQTDLIKDQLADKKELLAADRDNEIERINFIAEATKASLNNQLAAAQAHYAQLLAAKTLQAEAEKLIIDNNQKDIIKLLEGYGASYQITGQTLGEKMYEGFKEKVSQITSLIDSINRQIDAARSAAVSAMALASAASNASASKSASSAGPEGKTVTVNNTFNTPVTSPSDVTKAAQKTAQQLLLA